MEIGSVGYNYSHDSEFIMDRPNGIGCWLFLIVKTPALFVIDGQEHIVKDSSFVIFTPETPGSHRALNDTYTDDRMYFSAMKMISTFSMNMKFR
ncbi:MAG: hypothetical protein IJ446_07595 [Oscillospiraceae bacterium]|nr:hypothetical protein [Oscillospiraceae bacterium]